MRLPPQVAPDNPYLGVMLPYTPLHHLLMDELGFPIVATSGNVSGEPIVIDDEEALAKLGAVADLFLLHDRPIARHVDDSVAFVVEDKPVILRRARGYAPAPIRVPKRQSRHDGGRRAAEEHGRGRTSRQCLSQPASRRHGECRCLRCFQTHAERIFKRCTICIPRVIACDLHPDYASTRSAEQSGLKVVHVQHHYAHVLSCMAEHQLEAPVLGVAWDGTGYGTDGTIWGGEFLRVDAHGFTRAASLRPFRLPGGDLPRANRAAARSACSTNSTARICRANALGFHASANSICC